MEPIVSCSRTFPARQAAQCALGARLGKGQMTMALNDTESTIEPLRDLLDTLSRPTDDVQQR